ncbi:MAG: coproporphyrinogen III oxidase [Desulfobacterales bacterium CG23_combo_of_CG06-09_8_20_14_all_51_8]|nr:MAG: coproporphyrinogen III oxidase [Desulfobacterales bacterium CG23_combo_of_CG06-09_8_20_14_all_51_8]
MTGSREKEKTYSGFEQGPIRPPSEARSLLIRITRNCPWNRCAFCPVYKGEKFSLRPKDHVIQDIDAVSRHVSALRRMGNSQGQISQEDLNAYAAARDVSDRPAFYAAMNWFACGMESVFLLDANSLIIKPADLVDILRHLKTCFPWVSRITSYARSHTVARISDDDLSAIARSGLNRIHIGLESGADEVLAFVKKGADKKTQITAGQKVKKAGMELSEYVMPGLGGKKWSRIHALETADALNQIDPDFIRIRTLAIPGSVRLYDDIAAGCFEKLTDVETAEELLLFLENLDGIASQIKSDHILNLFEEVDGKLPEGKDRMTGVIREFLSMPPRQRMLYQVGRRVGLFSRLKDVHDPALLKRAEAVCREYGITPENVDDMITELMKRFI